MLSSGRSLGDPTGHLLSAEVQSVLSTAPQELPGSGGWTSGPGYLLSLGTAVHHPTSVTHHFAVEIAPLTSCTERNSDGGGALSRGFEEP